MSAFTLNFHQLVSFFQEVFYCRSNALPLEAKCATRYFLVPIKLRTVEHVFFISSCCQKVPLASNFSNQEGNNFNVGFQQLLIGLCVTIADTLILDPHNFTSIPHGQFLLLASIPDFSGQRRVNTLIRILRVHLDFSGQANVFNLKSCHESNSKLFLN